MIKPDKCHYHFNTCRDTVWGEKNCFIPHYIYLSKTSSIKVGITKYSQIPFRWINQGATQAITVLKVYSRYQAGLIENMIKNYIVDKTNWKKMLVTQYNDFDLLKTKSFIIGKIQNNIFDMNQILNSKIQILKNSRLIDLSYPIIKYPENVKSFNLDQNNKIHDKLIGIKGNYLIFKGGVINTRKISGYELSIDIV